MSTIGVCAVCGATFAGSWCPACREREQRPSPGALAPGRTFRGMEILGVLGRGGMATVYRARRPPSDRLVALKVLDAGAAIDPTLEMRFVREGQALSQLAHPRIVRVYESGREGDLLYIAMEYVEGESLRQHMAEGRFVIESVRRIVLDVCDALEYAHGRGVIHRDVKPENILIDGEGRARLADLGLAKIRGALAADLTESFIAVGTAHYMAPEQLENAKAVDHRADIYALGVVLYELLTGRLPGSPVEPPSEVAGTDPRLDAVVFRALARRPEHRTPSAAEFREGLLRATSRK